MATLAHIPAYVRESTVPPEERDMRLSELPDVAREVADRGVFTVLPFRTAGGAVRCRVLIWRDVDYRPSKP